MNRSGNTRLSKRERARNAGVTLVELLVALSIGSFLIIGAVQIATQSRQAFKVNESVAKVQETAQFAMDTIEADLRMASNWGKTSRGDSIDGRAIDGNADPFDLLPSAAEACGANWALDLTVPVEGSDNDYALGCAATGGEQADSDMITVRRAAAEPKASPEAGPIQIQSTRTQGLLFSGDAVPALFDPATSETHDLLVNSYYVAQSSELIPGVPTLRRKSLAVASGAPTVVDLEVAPGIENLQVQFGVDVNRDNTIDRYVNPGSPILDPDDVAFIPAARVMTARIWLVVRSIDREIGIVDNRDYEPGNVDLGVPDDDYRRLLVSKTILLRNTRT
jgi:type IV pilus assembly protein PilW